MKKIIAILCAAFALAACTETLITDSTDRLTAVEETTSDGDIKLNLTITRADDFGGETPGTKAVKTGWERGDVILVFFKTDVHKYLELKYNGSKWTATCKNGLTEDEIINASQKKLRAIHLSHNQFVRPTTSTTQYNMVLYYDYFLESGIVDYTYDKTRGLTSTLRMAAPEYTGSSAGKLIDFQVTGFDPSRTYYMNMKYLRKLSLYGIDHTNLTLSYTAFALDRNDERLITGRNDGDTMHFTGLLDASAVGTPVTFDFTILDQKDKIAFTCSVGPKTVNGNLSVDLGAISDGTKWKATPYEDMGIDNADGKRLYWGKYNVGASASPANPANPYGYYFSFGQIQGAFIEGTFGNYDCLLHNFYDDKLSDSELLARLDSNGNLKLEYDAAHATLGGAWRIPTADEMLLLYHNTTRSVYKPGGKPQASGITFTGTRSGYTDKSIFLPAAGFVSGATPQEQGTSLFYLTASTYEGLGKAFIRYLSSLDDPDSHSLWLGYGYGVGSSKGYPIRPVFTLQ